jgi:ribose 5-phosphate isomerase A
MHDNTQRKQQAAYRAVEQITSDMIVGLGTGSTAIWVVRRLAELLQQGKLANVVGIPTSVQTAAEARCLGVPLTTLEDHPVIDLTIDGADEVDPQLDLIKGGGGALLREKIVAQASRRVLIIVDESKRSPQLGTRWPVPVEVVSFGWRSQARYLTDLGATVKLRQTSDGANFVTDQGNLILDCHFGPVADPARLADQIKARTGMVDHGLFLGMAHEVIVAGKDGVYSLARMAVSENRTF